MDTGSRRAFLQAVVEAEDSSTRDRLKATELIDRLDGREGPQRTNADATADFERYYTEDEGWEERLVHLLELADEHLLPLLPAYNERVERRATELAREGFHVIDSEPLTGPVPTAETGVMENMGDDLPGAQEANGALDQGEEPAKREPGSHFEQVPPAIAAEIERRKNAPPPPRGLRDIGPSRILRSLDPTE